MRSASLRAVFDLGHMARLSYDPGLVLIISERTSYLLHNLAIADILDSNRYAIYPPVDGWYQPVVPEDENEYAIYEFIARQAELEFVEVGTVPIETLLYVSDETLTKVVTDTAYTHVMSFVPDGEVWEVESVFANVSVATTGQFGVYSSGDQNQWIVRVASLPLGVSTWQIRQSLAPGSRLVFIFWGLTIGQTVGGGYNFRALPVSVP